MSIRTASVRAEPVHEEQSAWRGNEKLTDTDKKPYAIVSAEEAQPFDYPVETTGLNSCEVLATLFTPELKRILLQLPGKQFTRVLS